MTRHIQSMGLPDVSRRRVLSWGIAAGAALALPRWARAQRPLVPHAALADIGTPFGTTHGVKTLSTDQSSGASTAFHSFPAPWKGGGVAHYHSCAEEVYVISGDITLNGRDELTAGSYLYRPGGIVHGHDEGSTGGCRCLIRTDGALDFNYIENPRSPEEYVEVPSDDGRPHIVHLRAPEMDWSARGAGPSAYGEKILSTDAKTGAQTSLLRLPAGWRGGVSLDADYGWEWFVIDGDMTCTDGTRFGAETYSYRPAGGVAFTEAAADTMLLLWKIA
jgi:quercetin dioxygenase-like cupin family protein